MTGDTHRVAAMSSPGRADMVTRSFTTDGSETRGAKGSALCEPQLEKMRENVTVLNKDLILSSSTAETRKQRCNRHKQRQRLERGRRRRRRELAPEADLPLSSQSRQSPRRTECYRAPSAVTTNQHHRRSIPSRPPVLRGRISCAAASCAFSRLCLWALKRPIGGWAG